MFKNWIQNQIKKANDQAVNQQVDFIKKQSEPAMARMALMSMLARLGVKSAQERVSNKFAKFYKMSGKKDPNGSITPSAKI